MGMKKTQEEAFRALKPVGVYEVEETTKLLRAKDVLPKQEYKPRDYDKEARGKTACALREAALQSPFMQNYTTKDEVLEAVRFLANALYKDIFPEE